MEPDLAEGIDGRVPVGYSRDPIFRHTPVSDWITANRSNYYWTSRANDPQPIFGVVQFCGIVNQSTRIAVHCGSARQ